MVLMGDIHRYTELVSMAVFINQFLHNWGASHCGKSGSRFVASTGQFLYVPVNYQFDSEHILFLLILLEGNLTVAYLAGSMLIWGMVTRSG